MHFTFIVLLLTNVWIYSYKLLLSFFNTRFPATPSSSFLIDGVSPEPFEIPLYIFLTLGMVLLFFILFSWQKFKSNPLFVRLFVIVSVTVFVMQLGAFPFTEEMRIYSFITPFIEIASLLVAGGYIIGILSIITTIIIVGDKLKKNKHYKTLLFGIVIFIIAVFTYEPGFPIYYHDYSQFFGPILEIVNGKTIYTETSSQYGFLFILILALLNKIGFFTIDNLPFIIWGLYTLQYFICFYLIYKISKSLAFSIICLFSILTINYFSLMHVPISVPESGAVRWSQMILAIFILYKFKNIHAKKLIFIIVFLSFLVVDAGIAIISAYILTLFFMFIKKHATLKQSAISLAYLIGAIVGLFLIIQIISLVAGYTFIDVKKIFDAIHKYGNEGFNLTKIPSKTYFWLFILFYFASLVYFIKSKTKKFVNLTILFAANLSFFASIYYVAESHPSNLISVSIVPLFAIFVLIAMWYHKRVKLEYLKPIVLVLLFFSFIIFPAFERRTSLSFIVYRKIDRLGVKLYEDKLPLYLIYQFCKPNKLHIFDTEINECLWLKYKNDIGMIKTSIPDEKIIIISPDDTYLFYLTKKKNVLQVNPQSSIFTKSDLNFAVEKVGAMCPERIVVDPRVYGIWKEDFETLDFFYSIQPQLLSKIESICHVRYKKTYCTDNLCIAQAVLDMNTKR